LGDASEFSIIAINYNDPGEDVGQEFLNDAINWH